MSNPKLEFDEDADAVYITLANAPYGYGEDLDDWRRVDYAADRTPIGVELLYVSGGVDLDGIPERDRIEPVLRKRGIDTSAAVRVHTLTEIGSMLDLDPSRLRRMIGRGLLKATKAGKTWLVTEPELKRFAGTPRRPGRPTSTSGRRGRRTNSMG